MIPTNVHWIGQFAARSSKLFSEAVQATSQLTSVVRIGEVGLEGGRFTLSVLRSGLEALRTHSSQPVELYRVEYGTNDLVRVVNSVKTDPDSYRDLPNVHTYFAIGMLHERIFAANSLNTLFISHLMTGVPVIEPAPDTIVPTLTQDAGIKERRKVQASQEFRRCLERRYEELIVGGQLVFDVLGEIGETESMFRLIDATVNEGIAQGYFDESIRQYGLNAYFRSYEEVLNDVQSLSSKFKVVSYEHHQVEMPQYRDFVTTGDAGAFADSLALFWRKVFQITLSRGISDSARVSDLVEKLVLIFRELAANSPPVVTAGSHHFTLEKLSEE